MHILSKGKSRYIAYLVIPTIFIIIVNFLKRNQTYKTEFLINKNKDDNKKVTVRETKSFTVCTKPKMEMKYILQWTSAMTYPFIHMGVGQSIFIQSNCTYTNCYVTSQRNFFENYTQFDVIAFAGPEILYFWKNALPEYRSPHQKYVYANIESAAYYPVCTNKFNGYFNWTWTYKLDSDVRWGYIVVRDAKRGIIGPTKDMHWIEHKDMLPVSDELKKVLRGKTKAAAWFVSNCFTMNRREYFVEKLRIKMKKYNLTLDIYGKCMQLKCPRESGDCDEIIRKDYYFYLSFENAFSEDYVTEKILHAVKHNAVPIVYGGANYTRFLPEKSYLDAKNLGVRKLAKKMHELINNFDQYVEYFRWTNHYSYYNKNESPETNEYCQICALLNNENKTKTRSSYKEFEKWWNPPNPYCYDNIVNYEQ